MRKLFLFLLLLISFLNYNLYSNSLGTSSLALPKVNLWLPTNNSIIEIPANKIVTFVWMQIPGAQPSIRYTIEAATNTNFDTVVFFQTDIVNVTVNAEDKFKTGKSYYWRVKAFDIVSGEEGPWSDVWKFTTKLAKPVLLSPLNNLTGISTTQIQFSWGAIDENATNINFYCATNDSFTTGLIKRENYGKYDTLTLTGLTPNTKYYWRVQVKNSTGTSDFSDVYNFTIANPQRRIENDNVLIDFIHSEGSINWLKFLKGSNQVLVDTIRNAANTPKRGFEKVAGETGTVLHSWNFNEGNIGSAVLVYKNSTYGTKTLTINWSSDGVDVTTKIEILPGKGPLTLGSFWRPGGDNTSVWDSLLVFNNLGVRNVNYISYPGTNLALFSGKAKAVAFWDSRSKTNEMVGYKYPWDTSSILINTNTSLEGPLFTIPKNNLSVTQTIEYYFTIRPQSSFESWIGLKGSNGIEPFSIEYPIKGEKIRGENTAPELSRFRKVKIEYASDGTNFSTITSADSVFGGTFAWKVPGPVSTQAKIRITNIDNPQDNVTSPTFKVLTPPNLSITTPPNTWKTGEVRFITWNAIGRRYLILEYSPDNGISWLLVDACVNASTGSYAWTVPIATPFAKLKITDLEDQTAYAITNTFSILPSSKLLKAEPEISVISSPAFNSFWQVGKVMNIKWESYGVANIKIEYSSNNGADFGLVIAASVPAEFGYYPWLIPMNFLPTTEGRIKLTAVENPEINKQSAKFEISNKIINITSPRGIECWPVNSQQNVIWTANNVFLVKGQYSTDGGTNWIDLNYGNFLTNPFVWTIPNSPTNNAKIRLYDALEPRVEVFSKTFQIVNDRNVVTSAIVYPNASTEWYIGKTNYIAWKTIPYTVKWKTDLPKGTQYKIFFTTNNGLKWDEKFVGRVTEPAGTLIETPIEIPLCNSSDCRIKIVKWDNNLALDTFKYYISDKFTVVATNSIEYSLEKDVISSPGSKITIPCKIRTFENSNVSSFDIRIQFNKNILTYLTDNSKTIFDITKWQTELTDSSKNGWIQFSGYAKSQDIKLEPNTEIVINFTFTVAANTKVGTKEEITFNTKYLSAADQNGKSISVTSTNGNYIIYTKFSGSIKYFARPFGVQNAILNANFVNNDKTQDFQIVDTIGFYALTGVEPCQEVTLRVNTDKIYPTYPNPYNPNTDKDPEIVTSTDALWAFQGREGGTRTLTGYQKIAADVNGDSIINSTDALLILKRSTKSITLFEDIKKTDKRWIFVDSSYNVAGNNWFIAPDFIKWGPVDAVVSGRTFIGIFYGDVDGSLTADTRPPATMKNINFASISSEVADMDNLYAKTVISLPSILYFKANDTITIPINVTPNGNKIAAFNVGLSYPTNKMQYLGVTTLGTAIPSIVGWVMDVNSKIPGSVNIGVANFSQTINPIGGNGSLVNLKFKLNHNLSLNDTIKLRLDGLSAGNQNGLMIPLEYSNGAIVINGTSDVEDDLLPKEYEISQNFPNPFNPSTKIKFALPYESNVEISIYNSLGQKVKSLINETRKAGYHEIDFDGRNIASGIYFYKIDATSKANDKTFSAIKKMMLVK